MKYWIGYVTHGREKYEYHTDIAGISTSLDIVCQKIRDKLVELHFVQDYEEDNKCSKEYVNFFEKKIWKPKKRETATVYLDRMIRNHDDSFQGDGWDYFIEEIKVDYPEVNEPGY